MFCQTLQKYCRVEMLLSILSTCVMFFFHILGSAFLSLMLTEEELTLYPGRCLLQTIEQDRGKIPNAGSLLRFPRN